MIYFKSIASSSAGNCYLLGDGETQILLECGIPWKGIMKGLDYQTSKLAGCLVTHLHGDHCKAIKDVIYHAVPVYATAETFNATCNGGFIAGKNVVKAGETFKVGTWTCVAFKTEHDVPGSVGFLLKNNIGQYALFLTDSAYSRFTFPPLHTVIIEANFSIDIINSNIRSGRIDASRKKRLISTHMSIERVVDMFDANDMSQCQAIHLIHLSNDNSDEDLFKKMVQRSTGIPTTVEAA